jgi:hypothetical protein
MYSDVKEHAAGGGFVGVYADPIFVARFIKALRLILYELILIFYFQANYQLLSETIQKYSNKTPWHHFHKSRQG